MNKTKETPLTERASGGDTGATNPIIYPTDQKRKLQTPEEILTPMAETAFRLELYGLVKDLARLLRRWKRRGQ